MFQDYTLRICFDAGPSLLVHWANNAIAQLWTQHRIPIAGELASGQPSWLFITVTFEYSSSTRNRLSAYVNGAQRTSRAVPTDPVATAASIAGGMPLYNTAWVGRRINRACWPDIAVSIPSFDMWN